MAFPRKTTKIPTEQSLGNAALHYLGRYAASEASLRRVLETRLRRAAMRNPDFAANEELRQRLKNAIDVIVEKHKKIGIINDQAFAEMKVSSLRRAGKSARAIRQKLSQKGLAAKDIDTGLASGDDAPEQAELKAARELARRKRIGPFRTREITPELQRKELAAMARAGFSLATARRILGKTDVDEEWNDDVA
jgi:regulatory protein